MEAEFKHELGKLKIGAYDEYFVVWFYNQRSDFRGKVTVWKDGQVTVVSPLNDDLVFDSPSSFLSSVKELSRE
jgi:ABC-type uncharacterized transport system substrate-binding protein